MIYFTEVLQTNGRMLLGTQGILGVVINQNRQIYCTIRNLHIARFTEQGIRFIRPAWRAYTGTAAAPTTRDERRFNLRLGGP